MCQPLMIIHLSTIRKWKNIKAEKVTNNNIRRIILRHMLMIGFQKDDIKQIPPQFTLNFREEFPRTANFLEEWHLIEAYCMGLVTYYKNVVLERQRQRLS